MRQMGKFLKSIVKKFKEIVTSDVCKNAENGVYHRSADEDLNSRFTPAKKEAKETSIRSVLSTYLKT